MQLNEIVEISYITPRLYSGIQVRISPTYNSNEELLKELESSIRTPPYEHQDPSFASAIHIKDYKNLLRSESHSLCGVVTEDISVNTPGEYNPNHD